MAVVVTMTKLTRNAINGLFLSTNPSPPDCKLSNRPSSHPIPNKFIERLIYLIKLRQLTNKNKNTDEHLRQKAFDELNEARENGTYEETVEKINWEYRFAVADEKKREALNMTNMVI